ncbi:SO_0444 family Cu/Zn efflux transporter [Shewanella algae]|uniref:SO_0444 family Cu/Zn efflux transporter n=1 Tax=Shewanella algae TaxID=38313 RepID=UPI001AB00957|nr:SO_0444 family Cu/Zn efflux transporter [Shewanella algae]MBO2584147.1 SO_0444 family Cu/Zn efflux transporter [Shewanella algae]
MLMDNFIELFLESAPWLLLGLVLAGLLKVFVPMSWMQKQLGGHGLKTTVKAALLGAPLPLCSCGVIPAAVGLRRSGASKAATTSFLVSTPETGVDSVTVSYVLLGPFMAIVRPIAAVCSAIVAGLLVGRDDEPVLPSEAVKMSEPEKAQAKTVAQFKSVGATNYSPLKAAPTQAQSSCCAPAKVQEADCCSTAKVSTAKASTAAASCCSSVKEEATQSCCSQPKVEAASCCSSSQSTSNCCDSDDMAAELKSKSVLHRVLAGLKYAATDLVRDTAIWLLVGLFFAALVQTYVPGDFLAQWGGGILAMLVMVLISIPMYICATASTPIAAGLLLAGVSPGAVLVFMLAGPATNIATLGVVAKEMGKRALYGYLGGVLGVALLAGMLVNLLVANFGFEVMPQIGEEHQLLPQAVVNWSGIILALLMAKVIYDKIPRRWLRRDCCSG